MWCIDIHVNKTLMHIKIFLKRREEVLGRENRVVLDPSLNRTVLCASAWPEG